MRVRITTPDGDKLIPVPGALALQLLAGQIKEEKVRRYLLEPGRCRALYEELERCCRRFPALKAVEVDPAQGGSIAVTLED